MHELALIFLGGFSAISRNTTITTFRSQKTKALLAYLAVESGRVHQRESLMDLLWSEQPAAQANNNFRQSLSRLQKAIANKDMVQPYLVVTRQTVQWDPNSEYTLDIDQFLRATDDALTQSDPTEAFNQLQRARALYHGDFLAGFFVTDAPQFDNWVASTREQLHQQFVRSLAHVADRIEEEELFEWIIDLSQHHLALTPWNELAHRRLMRAFALTGQPAKALAQFVQCTKALSIELGVAPSGETEELYQKILRGEFAAPRQGIDHRETVVGPKSEKPLYQLPIRVTHFVGRDQEIDELTMRLQNPVARLITLTGPGGIGKTSLALEIAAAFMAKRDSESNLGVAFVPLASVDKGEQFVAMVIQSLGLPQPTEGDPTEYLLSYLEAQDFLLVLDNYEQLLPKVGTNFSQTIDQSILIAILERAPKVTVLITSRVRLNLPQEWVYPLDGMTLPPSTELNTQNQDEINLEHYKQSNAVALFVRSAQQVHPPFMLTQQNAHAVARICQILEGTPLGLELAAAWVRALSCQEICTEIEQSLQFLTASSAQVPDRHRSLHAVFDSSWQRLSVGAQKVVLRLSIFRSQFDRAAATEIADASLLTLAELIDHSFVRRVGAGEYQMHELMRQLAAEKIEADKALYKQTQQSHAFYFSRYLEERTEPFLGDNANQVLFEIEERFGDIRLAWVYLVEHAHYRYLDAILDALNRFCRTRGRIAHGAELVEDALAAMEIHPRTSNETELYRARLMSRLGNFYVSLGEHKKAHVLVTETLQLCENLQLDIADDLANGPSLYDPNAGPDAARSLGATIAYCHWCLLFVPSATEDAEQVDRLYAKGVALYAQHGLEWGIANMHNIRGVIAHNRGELILAESMYQKSHQIFKDGDNYKGLSLTHHNLGKVNEELGNYADGLTHLQRSLHYTYALSDDEAAAFVLSSMARIGMYQGKYREAEEQATEALSRFERVRFQQGIAFSCDLLGEILYLQTKYEDAESYLTRGMMVCQQHGYPIEAALVATTHGTMALHLLEFARAQELGEQALAFARQAQSLSAEGPAHTLLGEIAAANEEFDLARSSFEQAIAIGKQISAPLVWLKARAGLAELELRAGNIAESQKLLREVAAHKATTYHLQQRIVANS